MKRPALLKSGLTACLLALGPVASAQVVLTQSYNIGSELIPDGDPTGLANIQQIATQGTIIDVTVQVSLGGDTASNGDLYMYLQHGSSLAVLLNRPGVDVGNPTGYSDPGMQLTFDDNASNGDIHVYRQTLFGSDNVPLGGPLTDSIAGPWQPDGRTTSPLSVATSDPRNATLSVFDSRSLAGSWTLFTADLATGHQSTIQSWSLTIAYNPLLGSGNPGAPENTWFAAGSAAGLLGWALWRCRRVP
jgi:subtilisin-like proprotein convertase family protein